jgi:hypothetical protein
MVLIEKLELSQAGNVLLGEVFANLYAERAVVRKIQSVVITRRVDGGQGVEEVLVGIEPEGFPALQAANAQQTYAGEERKTRQNACA